MENLSKCCGMPIYEESLVYQHPWGSPIIRTTFAYVPVCSNFKCRHVVGNPVMLENAPKEIVDSYNNHSWVLMHQSRKHPPFDFKMGKEEYLVPLHSNL